MEANDYCYSISSSWRSKPETPLVIGQKFLRTLDALSLLGPELQSWLLEGDLPEEGTPLNQARHAITEIVEAGLRSGDDGVPDIRYGYGAFSCTENLENSKSFKLSVSAGCEFDNEVTLLAGDYWTPVDDTLIRYPLFKGALLAIIENWPAPWAKVQVFKSELEHIPFGSHGAVEVRSKNVQRLSWLGYLCAERAKAITLPPDLLTEPTPDGGLLMIAAEQRLDPANATQMKHANLITEIMAKHGHDMNYKPN